MAGAKTDWGAWENFLSDGDILGLGRGWGYYMDLLNSLNCTLHILILYILNLIYVKLIILLYINFTPKEKWELQINIELNDTHAKIFTVIFTDVYNLFEIHQNHRMDW